MWRFLFHLIGFFHVLLFPSSGIPILKKSLIGDWTEKARRKPGGNDINVAMKNEGKPDVSVVAVSGGADSVYLLYHVVKRSPWVVVAHYNHRARGKASEEDRKFVERLSRKLGLPLETGTDRSREKGARASSESDKERWLPGFERKARDSRYAFLKEIRNKHGAKKILVAHTADDQVETVLMRVMEGAGISGFKGIPRSTEEGIERPLLDTWRGDVLRYLDEHDIPYRIDESNLDTRFERNWIRHVLLPLLAKRYGESVRKRIFTLGERFREIDAYVEINANEWVEKNCSITGKKKDYKRLSGETARFSRKAYGGLPSLLRIRILQILCFRRVGTSPGERLLGSMDRLIVSGNPSACLSIGKGYALRCRNEEAIISSAGDKATPRKRESRIGRQGKGKEHKSQRGAERGKTVKSGKTKRIAEPVFRLKGPGIYRWNRPARRGGGVEAGSPVSFVWEERGKIAPGRIRKMSGGERQAIFDAELLRLPLFVRPLKAGDRVRPLGLATDKKVKEILIDRKVPREERWGRPVMCDADGKIVWIPRILRSADAAVTPATRRTIVLRVEI
jgi:tRNA(Ile)-lysidine synthase